MKAMKAQDPTMWRAATIRLPSPTGTLWLTVNFDLKGEPISLFARVGKAGGETHALLEAIARIATLHLSEGGSIEGIVDELEGITSDRSVKAGSTTIMSTPDAIAKGLIQILSNEVADALEREAGDPSEKEDDDDEDSYTGYYQEP